tara:strand:- start:177 stop:884 length:708 start_codon:yes stop_codon:yes gene_type:complete
MRIQTTCPQCISEAGTYTAFMMQSQQLIDDGIHKVVCDKGHKYTVELRAQKFEMLFDIAVNAIGDGYMREAVASFAASLERFYEFFIKYHIHSLGIDESILLNTWKEVSNQSERQLGAFTFLFLAKYNKKAQTLDSNAAGFRNKVIHKGYIPTEAEAIDFGDNVYCIIKNTVQKLELSESESLSSYYSSSLPRSKGAKYSLTKQAEAISIDHKINGTSFRDYKSILKQFRIVDVR